jgi:hypothetical protein
VRIVQEPETDSDTEVKADLRRLISLVEASRVEEARVLVVELAAKWPDSGSVQHWRGVLEPPRAYHTPVPPARSLEREYAWLRAHAHEYPGCWIALHGDHLVAADPDRKRVMDEVGATCGAENALLFSQPKVPYR